MTPADGQSPSVGKGRVSRLLTFSPGLKEGRDEAVPDRESTGSSFCMIGKKKKPSWHSYHNKSVCLGLGKWPVKPRSFLCTGAKVSDGLDRCALILMASFSKPPWWATGPRFPDGPDGILTSAEACGASQELTMGLQRLGYCWGEKLAGIGIYVGQVWAGGAAGWLETGRCARKSQWAHEKQIQIRFLSSCPCEPHGSPCPRCIYLATLPAP